jgi:hypothetical protein
MARRRKIKRLAGSAEHHEMTAFELAKHAIAQAENGGSRIRGDRPSRKNCEAAMRYYESAVGSAFGSYTHRQESRPKDTGKTGERMHEAHIKVNELRHQIQRKCFRK